MAFACDIDSSAHYIPVKIPLQDIPGKIIRRLGLAAPTIYSGKELKEIHQKARYYPQDRAYLPELEPYVSHYELLGHLPT